jgi:hypothetical protein
MQTKWKILAGIIVLLIALAGSTLWKRSSLVTFQEYRPSATLGGFSVTDESLVVTSARTHRGMRISKKLVLELGSGAEISESDTSVYSNYNVDCSGTVGGCRLLHDSNGQPIRLAVQLNGDSTPMNQEIEYVKGKTLIAITCNLPTLLKDSDIVNFINSLQSYKYSGIKVLQQ